MPQPSTPTTRLGASDARPPIVPRVSVVVPAYDEEESVPVLVSEIRAALDGAGLDFEVLLVDDGSTDGTLAAMLAEAGADPRVRVLRQPSNRGQSAALQAGWRAARGEVVVTLDGDLQNDPADVPKLLAALEEGYDVVNGVRVERRDDWRRRLSSRIANGVRNRLTRDSVTDVGCTLRAVRAEFLRDLPMFTGLHRFLPTLLKLRGARVTEVAVSHRPRRFGATKYGIHNRLWKALSDLMAVRWMQRRWIDPRDVEEVTPEPAGEDT